MPIESSVAVCGNCGAELEPYGARSTVKCAYCGRTSVVGSPVASNAASPEPVSALTGLLGELAGGLWSRNVGEGRRYRANDENVVPWVAFDRSIWPTRANASSSYGSAWSPMVLIGPPRVFPRSGDIAGAWAPRPSHSAVEWIEVEYASDVPVNAIRVFETHRAGSTFAVVDLTNGETLVWSAGPQSGDGAQVLEIAVTPPRVIRKLRVYVSNQGWAEIDTVGLVSALPLPPALRAPANTLIRKSMPVGMIAVFGIIVTALVVVGISAARGSSSTHVPTGIVDMDWHTNVTAYRGANGAVLTVRCAANGDPGDVWGSDVYSDDSSVCTAAVHAGRIAFATGGVVTVELRPGRDSYDSTTRNGVTSRTYGRWSGSFVIR